MFVPRREWEGFYVLRTHKLSASPGAFSLWAPFVVICEQLLKASLNVHYLLQPSCVSLPLREPLQVVYRLLVHTAQRLGPWEVGAWLELGAAATIALPFAILAA